MTPSYEIPRRLGAILERVDRVPDAVTVQGEIDTVACLRDTTALMNDISSATEYLRTIVNAIANRPGGKKSEAAVRKKLDQLANRSFKVPINKIKHDGSELAWPGPARAINGTSCLWPRQSPFEQLCSSSEIVHPRQRPPPP